MYINQAGLDLIKHFEGFCADAYYCPARVLTIGYGTTGSRVKSGMKIDEKTAEQWLLEDVKKFADGVKSLIKVKLASNQFSALVCFTYNVGLGAFSKSTMLRKLNDGDYQGAAAEFDRWVKGEGRTLPGLVRRRNAEKTLFLKPDSTVTQERKHVELPDNVGALADTQIQQETSAKNNFSSMNTTLYQSKPVRSDRNSHHFPNISQTKNLQSPQATR